MRKSDLHMPRTQAFTLVEMMVVIVIVAIILGITAPAFQRLATGNAVDTSARMISSQLNLARAEAIARRKYVAVIMPGPGYKRADAQDSIYNFQSFRAAFVDSDNKFIDWVEGTEWTFLPTGAVIVSVYGDEIALDDIINPDGSISKIPKGSWSPEYKYNGSAVTGVSAGDPVRAVVFKPNGRAAEKLYITIMEGVYTEATYEQYKDNNNGTPERENLSNIRVMEINQYTGQVRFLY